MAKKAFTLIELLIVMSVISLSTAILVPALAKARQQGRYIFCMNNLRQMAIAANCYTINHDGYYPLAGYIDYDNGATLEWDFHKMPDTNTMDVCDVKPGYLWGGQTIEKIQQCPSFNGSANSPHDPYTGYNYNASYIGGVFQKFSGILYGMNSSKALEVKRPSNCAIFGDGQLSVNGANKYMRAPFVGKLDPSYASLRPLGTQGFRHGGRTNVAWCDGHVTSQRDKYTNTYPPLEPLISEGTGFLSEDNSVYDLK